METDWVPLPRTSPITRRSPWGVSCAAYRSPPMRASSWAAWYRAARASPRTRSGTVGSIARWTASATWRDVRSCSRSRANIRLRNAATTVRVRRVVKPMTFARESTSSFSRNDSSQPVRQATAPLVIVQGSGYIGAAISDTVASSGNVLNGGQARSTTTATTTTAGGRARDQASRLERFVRWYRSIRRAPGRSVASCAPVFGMPSRAATGRVRWRPARPGAAQAAGGMFWLAWKKLSGS